jgi:hypothetical protein
MSIGNQENGLGHGIDGFNFLKYYLDLKTKQMAFHCTQKKILKLKIL